MPRVVRNFWIEVECEGYRGKLACGPRSKDGGFQLRIYMRDRKAVTRAADITGHVTRDGSTLVLDAKLVGNPQMQVVSFRD